MKLRAALALWLFTLSALGGTVATPPARIVLGLRHTLFPEKDDTAQLSRAGKKEVAKKRNALSRELQKKAEETYDRSDFLKSMSVVLVPFIHTEPEGRSLLEQLRGKRPPDQESALAQIAVLPKPEWDSLRKDYPELVALEYPQANGRGGPLAVVYEPARMKEKLPAFERIDRATEAYVDDFFQKKLGLHPSEASEIATRLKAQMRQTLSSKSGKDMDRELVRAIADRYVKETLAPDLSTAWKGHDPSQLVTSSHKPGERETASDGGHKTIPTTLAPPEPSGAKPKK